MKSKEVIKKEIEGRKKTLERAEKYGFQELAEQCKEDITKYNQILKDLDELEKLKNLMGTPIQDIMKRLKILEIIKKWSFLDTFYKEDTDTIYDAFKCNIHTRGMEEDFKKVKEWWLDGKD